LTNNLLASLISGSAIPVKRHGVSGFPSAGGVTPIDDENLKVYWKFNEDSGNIINVSESDETLGSGANITMSNGGYDVGGTPADLGNAVDFNGTSSFGVCGTSTSQFNFMHNTSAEFTVAFWLKVGSAPDEDFLMDTAYTEGTQVGFKIQLVSTMALQFLIVRGTDGTRVLSQKTSNNFIPDTDWHFYTWTFDYSGSSPQSTVTRDNDNEETATKTSDGASDGNSTYPLYIAKRTGSPSQFGDFEACEWSIWNRVLTADEITSLYNDGDGREIY